MSARRPATESASRMRIGGYSLRWRLPLLISALIFVVLGTFLGATYREVARLQIQEAGARARLAADQLSNLLEQTLPQRLREARRLAQSPAVMACLDGGTPDACGELADAFGALPGNTPRVVELWNGTGDHRLAAIVSPPSSKVPPPGAAPTRAAVGVGALHRQGDALYTDTVIEVPAPALEASRGAERAPFGFIVVRRQLATAGTRSLLNRLVGNGASIKIGNRSGDVWTDLATVVPAPSVDLSRTDVARYRAADGTRYVGALSHIRNTPWAVWVEFPEAVVLAPGRGMMRELMTVGVLFLLVASGSAWIISGRITNPLLQLTELSEAIASGEYTRRIETTRRDEIGRLAHASNQMAASIQGAREQLERRVAERTAALEAANSELEAFTYSVSHDLRAPLRHISGFAALLTRSAESRLEDIDRRYLTTITGAADRMGRLIDDLLAFSRTGRSPVARRPVDLLSLVEEVRREVMAASPGRTIRWTIHPLPEVQADPAMLRLVVVNLLTNAVKYTAKREAAAIEVGSTRGADGSVTVFVRDNGVGFDMQYAHKLFGVFQRLHSSDDFEGTGIGLANVRRIVVRHGGRVWAEGKVDAGATFYFTLPKS